MRHRSLSVQGHVLTAVGLLLQGHQHGLLEVWRFCVSAVLPLGGRRAVGVRKRGVGDAVLLGGAPVAEDRVAPGRVPVHRERVRVIGRHEDQRVVGAGQVHGHRDGFAELDGVAQRQDGTVLVMAVVDAPPWDTETLKEILRLC